MATPSTRSKFKGATGAFRLVAYIEGVTYLVLLIAAVTKRVSGGGEELIGILGPIHGIAFLVYVVLVLRIREGQGWGFWRTIFVVVLSAVPFGGFWAGSHLNEGEPAPGVASARPRP